MWAVLVDWLFFGHLISVFLIKMQYFISWQHPLEIHSFEECPLSNSILLILFKRWFEYYVLPTLWWRCNDYKASMGPDFFSSLSLLVSSMHASFLRSSFFHSTKVGNGEVQTQFNTWCIRPQDHQWLFSL